MFEQDVWASAGTVFAIQAALAIGRMIAGSIAAIRTPHQIWIPSLSLAIAGTAVIIVSSGSPWLVAFAGIVGLCSGACQTAALTALIKRTHGSRAATRASTVWNICLGLGLGAFAVGSVSR